MYELRYRLVGDGGLSNCQNSQSARKQHQGTSGGGAERNIAYGTVRYNTVWYGTVPYDPYKGIVRYCTVESDRVTKTEEGYSEK